MCISYIVSIIALVLMTYFLVINYNQNEISKKLSKENFYPYRYWGNNINSGQWGWKSSYLEDTGNWRPYQYYPAYSGYWKQCNNSSWSPPYFSC
jgi:hypothetical protein